MTNDHLIEQRVLSLEDALAVSHAKMAFVREVDEAVNAGRRFVEVPDTALASLTIEVGAPVERSWPYADLAGHLGRVSFSLCFLGSEQVTLADSADTAIGQWVSWHPITLDGAAWLPERDFAPNEAPYLEMCARFVREPAVARLRLAGGRRRAHAGLLTPSPDPPTAYR